MVESPAVRCDGCGVCCFHMGFPAFNLTLEIMQGSESFTGSRDSAAGQDWERWQRLPGSLREELVRVTEAYESDGSLDGPCTWLDLETRRCRHHEHRPQVCRDFEIGCQQCREWRRVYRDRIIEL